MSETPVRDLLADADGIGAATVERLEDHGFETVAALADATHDELIAIPYVSDLRAEQLQSLADEAHTDPRKIVLDADLGDRLTLGLWDNIRTVIATEEATEWRSADGENWRTRRIRIADSPTADDRTEYDLIVTGDGVYLTGTCHEHEPVASVEHDGTVQNSTLVRLQVEQGADESESEKPDGDDSWRQYHRGEA